MCLTSWVVVCYTYKRFNCVHLSILRHKLARESTMLKKNLFVVLVVAAILGLCVGVMLGQATVDIPQSTASALAAEQYVGGLVIDSYILPPDGLESIILTTRVFLICGVRDNLLHKVKVSGTYKSPVVTDMGSVNGVVCK